MFVITDIGKLFLFFTYHDNHVIHGSRILYFLDYGSQKINSVDHVSRETPLRPLLLPFCPQGSANPKTEDNSWLLNSEGNRDGILVKGRRQTLLHRYKWGRGKHFVLRKIRKTAANKSIIARNRTRTSKEPWNKNGSKSTNHKLQTLTFWTFWNERLLPKRSAKEARNWQVTQT